MKIQNGQRLVMMGDSVTDMGRAKGVSGYEPSEGLFDPLGTGYPHVVSGLLDAVYPERVIRVTNVGLSGNQVRHLKERWQRDVLDLKPDWLSIMIGINDVWRQFDSPQIPEQSVPLAEYEETLEELVTRTVPVLAGGLVLMTPYFIEPNPNDAMRAKMDQYGAACRRIAERTGVILVDTQAAFNVALRFRYSGYFAWDRVHPNMSGATILARALLQALDFDFAHQPQTT